MRIALDAMGTDRHPDVEVQGAVQALRDLPGDFSLVLVGDQAKIEAALERAGDYPQDRLDIVHASQTIAGSDSPAAAVRRKPDSSIAIGLALHKRGEADAFISAGNTGATMAASLFLLGKLPGVARPTVATMLPTAKGPMLLADAGANVDCKPQQLLQFAQLAAVYVKDVLKIADPRIGLLNIGEEPEKGNEAAVEAYRLLSESGLNFIGNVEGRDIIRGVCDVLVADGFVGNVLLKFYESVATFMYRLVASGLGEKAREVDLDRIFHLFDWTEYGGAPLLGVNGVSIVCHGGSPPRAIRNAVRVAIQAVENRMVGHIEAEIQRTADADDGVMEAAHGKADRVPEGA